MSRMLAQGPSPTLQDPPVGGAPAETPRPARPLPEAFKAKRPEGVDYHALPVVKEEVWPDGIRRAWIASPFPILDSRVECPRGSDLSRAVRRTLPLAELRSSQATVTVNGLDAPRDDSHGLPLVVRSNGILYIQDGHHRLAKDHFAGRRHADVRLVDLDQGRP